MKGKIKFFNEMKDFGFIVGDDGKEYFVHSSGLNSGVSVSEGDLVTFEVEQGNKGPKAVKVSTDLSDEKEESQDDEDVKVDDEDSEDLDDEDSEDLDDEDSDDEDVKADDDDSEKKD
jgi:cold shock protein